MSGHQRRPTKFLSFLKALYANSRGRIQVYEKLSPEFTTFSGVRQGCPFSPFLFNFVIDILMESVHISDTGGVELLPGRCLSDISLLGSDPVQIQIILNNINTSAAKFGMRFAPPKCKVLLQDWFLQDNPSNW